jgi:hypothetical protein
MSIFSFALDAAAAFWFRDALPTDVSVPPSDRVTHTNQLMVPKSSRIRCDNIQKYHQFFSVIVQTFVGGEHAHMQRLSDLGANVCISGFLAVIMIIRTYAIYERDRRVLASLTIVALTVIAVGVVRPNSFFKRFLK